MAEEAHKSDAQRAAEADVESFRRRLGPFVAAVEKTRTPIVFTDARTPDNLVIFANPSFLALTGYEYAEVLGESLLSLLGHGAEPQSLTDLARSFLGVFDMQQELQLARKDGGKLWASVFVSPVKDDASNIIQHFVSVLDLTEHKQAEADARNMIHELNHRVKNTLASVLAIIRLALGKCSNPQSIREAIESRVFALARSHDLLNEAKWKHAGLRDIVDAALAPFVENHADRVALEGEDIKVSPKITLALSVALHELASNAMKYGAFSNDKGSVSIAWTMEGTSEGDRLMLLWKERNGPLVGAPSHKGFGSQVIERGLRLELQGSVGLEYHPQGVVCTFDIPAPEASYVR